MEIILGGKWALKAVGSRSGRVGPGRVGWMVLGCRLEGEWREVGGRMRGANERRMVCSFVNYVSHVCLYCT